MRKLSEAQQQSPAGVLVSELARAAPDWTAQSTHDPGSTVLEVLAYVLTDLQNTASPGSTRMAECWRGRWLN